jgi:general secretion pathway protein D
VTPADLLASVRLLNLEGEKGIGVTFQPFPAQNQMLVSGPPEAVSIALDSLAYFDIAAPQVFIEAKVVELTSDSNFEYGLDYLFDRNLAGPDTIWRGISSILSPPSFIASTLPGGLPFQGTNLLFGLVGSNSISVGAFELALRALQENGKAEILSKPSIICTQGVPAEVTTEEAFEVNRFTGANRNTSRDPAGNTTVATGENYGVAPAKTGVKMSVTAKHIGNSFVTIDLTPTVTGLAGAGTRVGGTFTPITTTRSAHTVVTLGDGETLVIGGLYTNRLVKEEARTPFLSDLPLLGTLFTRQHESKQKTELIFMLTPRIIRKNADARVIMPPAELARLEQNPGEGKGSPCGPCAPNTSMEDVLFPKGAACRHEQQREARAAAQAAPVSPSGPPPNGPPPNGPPSSGPPSSGPPLYGPPMGPPTASPRPPPPPPPPPPPSESPAPVRTR